MGDGEPAVLLGGKEIWWYQDDLDSNSACRPDLRPDLKGGMNIVISRIPYIYLHKLNTIRHCCPRHRKSEGRRDVTTGGVCARNTGAGGHVHIDEITLELPMIYDSWPSEFLFWCCQVW